MLISASITPLVFAGPEYDRQLAELTAARDKAIADASEPINHRYQIALQDLLRKATTANDVDSAVKIKAALTSAEPNGLGWRFRGRWATQSGGSHLQFTPGGNFQEAWHGTLQEGRWQATSDTDAKVTLNKGTSHEYHLSDDGKILKRVDDGVTWGREN